MDIVEALKKAKIVKEAYLQYSLNNGCEISLDDLTKIVQDYAEIEICVKSVGYSADCIYARLLRYPSEAEIVFSSDLNQCHRRYVVTKELSHLIIDTDDSFTKDFNGLVTGLIDGNYQQIDDALQSENIAHYVACELLLPFELRQGYIDSLTSEKTTYYQIAKTHRIPETVVKSVLQASIHKSLQSIMDKVG